jgi:hypothetical protein
MATWAPQLGLALNANQNPVNFAQKRCQLSALTSFNSGNVKREEDENAGIATDTAINASRSIESGRRKRAEGVLQAVNSRLNMTVSAFLRGGKVSPTLQTDLTSAGIYGLVAEVVDSAFQLALKQAGWNQDVVKRREILGSTLMTTFSNQQGCFAETAKIGGEQMLFSRLLNQQLDLLSPYMQPVRAVTAAAPVRQALPALPLQP